MVHLPNILETWDIPLIHIWIYGFGGRKKSLDGR